MEPVVFALIVLVIGMALVAALAPRFGADSRTEGPNWPGGPLERGWHQQPHG